MTQHDQSNSFSAAGHRRQRCRIEIYGAVQGVGFRPFVHGLAERLKLAGWVRNTDRGVVIEVEGTAPALAEFTQRLDRDKPDAAVFQSVQTLYLDPAGDKSFVIETSEDGAGSQPKSAWILPDLASCAVCQKETFDPADRRYRYPFTNCTHCGPRYSIVERLPYDRPNTSMKDFKMCPDCLAEYTDPSNRRFHAQPNACPACGPHAELWDANGTCLQKNHAALQAAARAVQEGQIVAVKGLGGFHLVVDAGNEEAVKRLRQKKHREEKPLAVMFASADAVRNCCEVSDTEQALLLSAAAPIVLLRKKESRTQPAAEPAPGPAAEPSTDTNNQTPRLLIAPSVAPGNPFLGAFISNALLYHLLLAELKGPVVATSANLTDEPICIDNQEALTRLKGIADVFLVNNRPIVRHVDDSVARVIAGRPMILRRARGYAPLPVSLKEELPATLGLGGHLKNTVALCVGHNVFLSQHIGDLETDLSFQSFTRTIDTLKDLYAAEPAVIACDSHPRYFSTDYAKTYAQQHRVPVIRVQHHHAHIAACLAENHLTGPVCGIAFDGTGYGADQTIWGGEILKATLSEFTRAGHLKTFDLIGGDRAVKEANRSGLSLLIAAFGLDVCERTKSRDPELPGVKTFSREDLKLLAQMFEKRLNVIPTSSLGRLFDGVASLIGVQHVNHFEGQAAMALEFLCHTASPAQATKECYSFELLDTIGSAEKGKERPPDETRNFNRDAPWILDWTPMIRQIAEDSFQGVSTTTIALKFHHTIVEMIVAAAKKVDEPKVALSGGCFQNKYLIERAIVRLREEGFDPYWHQLIPPNDGCLALGQVAAAGNKSKRIKE